MVHVGAYLTTFLTTFDYIGLHDQIFCDKISGEGFEPVTTALDSDDLERHASFSSSPDRLQLFLWRRYNIFTAYSVGLHLPASKPLLPVFQLHLISIS